MLGITPVAMVYSSTPTINIIDSRDSTDFYIIVGDCKIRVKREYLKDEDRLVDLVYKLCIEGKQGEPK